LGKLKFLNGETPDTVHPSLWRQSKLNSIHGLFLFFLSFFFLRPSDNLAFISLFEVIESAIYQVRGFDFANMTFLRTDQGWIVVDPLSCNATARVALELFRKHGPPATRDLPIKAIIITQSHMDHFGGIRGIIEAPNVAKDVQIIAPFKFTEHALGDNALAGTVIGRRSTYMYGSLLQWSPLGTVGSGLGHTIAKGPSGFIPPTHEVKVEFQESQR
jgi:alkyl sulfatase BDS1-like metallo-beta-lactamase superfamily hydrolase